MKYWEVIADKLGASGWSWGCSSHIDLAGRVLFTADAHRDNGKRFIVIADEKLTAFLELEKSQFKSVVSVVFASRLILLCLWRIRLSNDGCWSGSVF
jgi:hypothetical protein